MFRSLIPPKRRFRFVGLYKLSSPRLLSDVNGLQSLSVPTHAIALLRVPQYPSTPLIQSAHPHIRIYNCQLPTTFSPPITSPTRITKQHTSRPLIDNPQLRRSQPRGQQPNLVSLFRLLFPYSSLPLSNLVTFSRKHSNYL